MIQELKSSMRLRNEARAWLNRYDGSCQVIRVVPSHAPVGHQCYELFAAYDPAGENLGRVLFDTQSFWIYDGYDLRIDEQEHVASFIINYVERI